MSLELLCNGFSPITDDELFYVNGGCDGSPPTAADAVHDSGEGQVTIIVCNDGTVLTNGTDGQWDIVWPNGDVDQNVPLSNDEIAAMVDGVLEGAAGVYSSGPADDSGDGGNCGGGTQTGPEPHVVSTGGGGGCAA
ncbi:MAG: hypothetical protein JW874_13580 [Spirochaetales bacterium]|nr:hypothetical protein [Spirochaetales bacterium]